MWPAFPPRIPPEPGFTYQVYLWRFGEERPAAPTAIVDDSAGTYCVLPSGLPEGEYRWQVVADRAGSSAESDVWDLTLGGGSQPAAPSLLPPEDIPSLHPVLSWEPAAGATVYEVYLWRDGEPEPGEP